MVYKVLHEVTPSFLSRVILYHKPCLLETKNSVGEMRERHLTSHNPFDFSRLHIGIGYILGGPKPFISAAAIDNKCVVNKCPLVRSLQCG